MNRMCVETRGIGSWRERLAKPDRQWRRGFSAMEAAASWEGASNTPSGLPGPVEELFHGTTFGDPVLMVGIAEHKVSLAGRGGASQCDVWALLDSTGGPISLAVEAKARESFGNDNETLDQWLLAGETANSLQNRQTRWASIEANLPVAQGGGYMPVPYQLLHRCAAAVLEARRLRLRNAAFIVQAFGAPAQSFLAFSGMYGAMGLPAGRGQMMFTPVGDVTLGVGWADCPLATDQQLSAVV